MVSPALRPLYNELRAKHGSHVVTMMLLMMTCYPGIGYSACPLNGSGTVSVFAGQSAEHALSLLSNERETSGNDRSSTWVSPSSHNHSRKPQPHSSNPGRRNEGSGTSENRRRIPQDARSNSSSQPSRLSGGRHQIPQSRQTTLPSNPRMEEWLGSASTRVPVS